MARRPARARAGARARPRTAEQAGQPESDRDKIIAAFMALLAEKPFEDIGLGEIAARAGVSLATLRQEFSSPLAILAAHMKAIDIKVLAETGTDMTEEPPRERLFDVLMRRIDALAPYKDAVRSLLYSAMSDPALACALNAMAVRSQQWMLAAADIGSSGPLGLVRAQGLALLFADVLRTFVRDEDPTHARTMAALDRALARGARWGALLDELYHFSPARLCRLMQPRHRRRGRAFGGEGAAAA